jgi:hypothetical protein
VTGLRLIFSRNADVVRAVDAEPHLRARLRAFHSDRRSQPDVPQPIPIRRQILHQVAKRAFGRMRRRCDLGATAGPAASFHEFCSKTRLGKRRRYKPPSRHAAKFTLFKAGIRRLHLGGRRRQKQKECKVAHAGIVDGFNLPRRGSRGVAARRSRRWTGFLIAFRPIAAVAP